MKIENLKIFLTVAQTGNIHKTAEIFFTSYQNISFIIKNMEKELGFLLFTRDNRGMHLTLEGEELLKIAEPFVRAYEDFLVVQSTKNDVPVYHFYTTAIMNRYIRSLEDMLYSDYYYCSSKSISVSDMLDMIANNQPGIFLIPGSDIVLQNNLEQKDDIILAKDKNIILCHKSNAVVEKLPLSFDDIKKLPIVCSGDYKQQIGKYVMLNIDEVELCKKYMREKGFCYSTTRFIFEHDFLEPDEWVVLAENQKMQIAYHLIFNLPKHQLEIAKHFFLPPLQDLFHDIKYK